ncbi:MAG: sulfurtransferase, partial [Dehalococcoidia bacterium]
MTITHPSERGYALDNVFVTTDWLADHINDPDIRVVDTDVPELYAEEHIPVAVNPVDHYYKTSLDDRTHIQVPEVFAQTMQDLGIGDDTLVIAYDRSGGVYSFRLMWALHYHGFTNVRFLDGGLQKWKSEGRETSPEPVSRSGETYNNKGFTPKVNSEI